MPIRVLFALAAILSVYLPIWFVQSGDAQGSRYVLRIDNQSTYDVYKLYVSSSERTRWGPDLLGRNGVLRTGSSWRITDIQAGEYDVKFVDQDGDECILSNINIFRDTSWNLTKDFLLKCEQRSASR
jgi:hypothetical protein